MLRIAICDDNPHALAHLESLINQYSFERNLQIHYEAFSNANDFLNRASQGTHFDVCCLDILMPTLSGMNLARKLRERNNNISIIFCTSSPEFALQSYQVRAMNYLLKPVQSLQLFEALNEVLHHIELQDSNYILVKQEGILQKIPTREILYLEVLGHMISYHTLSQVFSCRGTFSKVIDQLLPYGNFAIPHRSYCINLNHVTAISQNEIQLANHNTLKFSPRKITAFKQDYLRYTMK